MNKKNIYVVLSQIFGLKVFKNIKDNIPKNSVVTIGFFDGVHLGHRFLIRQLLDFARNKSVPSLIITIWPHPSFVLRNKNPELLNCLDEKIALIEQLNPDALLILDFNNEIASLTSNDFINTLLINNINAKYLLKGFNNSFGNKNKSDNLDNNNIEVHVADQFLIEGNKTINSTKIRELLKIGNVQEASDMLGYKYKIKGSIKHGYRIGRTIGFPTANLGDVCSHKLIPANGVYYTTVNIKGKEYPSMLNVGTRPTFGDNERSIEFHIPNFEADLYDEEVEVYFYDKIRDEIKFANKNDLIEKLDSDKELVLKYFKEKF